MKTHSHLLIIVSCLFCCSSGVLLGDDIPKKSQSSETRVASKLDQHETDIKSLDRRFLETLRTLVKDYVEQRQQLRNKVVKSLRREQESHTKNGELDQAVAIRNEIRKLEQTEIVTPDGTYQSDLDQVAGKAQRRTGILGSWRWNNGVDITNLAGGNTSGQGTWRLVDPRKQQYEFRWKQIPPDRVTLSANGRVLEGTKATDPSFRVWAVRID